MSTCSVYPMKPTNSFKLFVYIKDKTTDTMSSSTITVPVPVVIWSKDSKRITKCSVSMHTTFQDIIRDLQVEGVKAVLVGHSMGHPFKLLPGDWEPDVLSGGPTTKADTFGHELVIIVGWMNFLEDPYCWITEAKTAIEEIYDHQHMLPQCLTNHTVHLFTYNHREVDCCDGKLGPWSERDPTATTAADNLWLRLEQEYLLRNNRFYERLGEADWAHATPGSDIQSYRLLKPRSRYRDELRNLLQSLNDTSTHPCMYQLRNFVSKS
jgi:hypothetical protein